MERDHDDAPGYQRLPRPDASYPGDTSPAWQAGMTRDSGIRRTRRASTWTAAALIAGVAATAGYFAHASPAATPTGVTTGAPATGTATHHKACLAAPVATSGGSGVTAVMPASGSCAGGGGATAVPAWSERDN